MKTPGAVLSTQILEQGVQVKLENAIVQFYIIDESAIRYRLTFHNSITERNYALQKTNWQDATDHLFDRRITAADVNFEVKESDSHLTISTNKLTLSLDKLQWRLTAFDSLCRTVFEELENRSVYLDANQRLNQTFKRNDSDFWYGLGEKTGPLDRSSRRFRMESTDAVGYHPASADPLYKHIPFLIRAQSAGVFTGLYYNNAWPSDFDIGCTRSGYWGEFGSVRFDGGDLDLTLIQSESIADTVKQYTQLTGLPPVMPRYSLGYLGSTMFYTELAERSDHAIERFIEKCRREEIPVSGFHLSSGYTTGEDGKRYAFEWNASRFPDPDRFIREFNDNHLALSPNIKPGVLTTHPDFDAMQAEQAFIQCHSKTAPHLEQFWGGQAALVDFTSEQGRLAWKKRLKESLIAKGISSIWNDNNEFEFTDPSVLTKGDGFGEPANGLRPILSNLMAKVAYDAVREVHPNIRPFILSRGGFAGLQHWAHTWSGDNGSSWEYFRSNITTMLGMSLSGVPFNGMDLGGFTGPAPEPELFLRWIQNGVFHPRFCIHSANDDNTVTEPWMHESIKPYVVEAMQLRYKLMPYLYQLAIETSRNGRAITAPLVYHFWDDPNCRTQSLDLMLGDACFVPTIAQKGLRKKQQYFPNDERFFDAQSGERYQGGRSYTINTPIEKNTWFLRAGHWMVLSNDAFNDDFRFLTNLQESTFEFYWDDGKTYDFERSDYTRVNLSLTQTPTGFEISWTKSGDRSLEGGSIEFDLLSDFGCPMTIMLEGSDLNQHLYKENWQTETEGFWYNAERKSLHIKLETKRLMQPGTLALNFANRIAVSI